MLKAPVRAAIEDAQPIEIDENGVVVFGVPKRRFDAINERFRKEADAIKDAFAQQLGSTPKFKLRAHDFDAPDAFRPPSRPAATEPEPPPAEEPEHEAVDLNELVDATDERPPDSVARLVADLGAEVVEERPRA